MKHIKLFEAWDQEMAEQTQILLGFFADGGYGSHPTIIESSMLPAIENHPMNLIFIETEELSEMPEALLVIHNDYEALPIEGQVESWVIRGISNDLANSIISAGGTDMYINQDPNSSPGVKEAFKLAGIEENLDSNAVTILCVIPDAKINTVYWSDNPERAHGYWETPYDTIPLEELLGKYTDMQKKVDDIKRGNGSGRPAQLS
jgi:hypothetical protein